MLDSPLLVDQNMVCGSNKDQRDQFPRINLDVSFFSGIHQICIPTFPFDPTHAKWYIHNLIDSKYSIVKYIYCIYGRMYTYTVYA